MSNQPQYHRLNEFVPHYVPKSDFLPTNQVVDQHQHEAQDVVILPTISFAATKSKKPVVMSTPSALLSLILVAT